MTKWGFAWLLEANWFVGEDSSPAVAVGDEGLCCVSEELIEQRRSSVRVDTATDQTRVLLRRDHHGRAQRSFARRLAQVLGDDIDTHLAVDRLYEPHEAKQPCVLEGVEGCLVRKGPEVDDPLRPMVTDDRREVGGWWRGDHRAPATAERSSEVDGIANN